MQPVTAQNYNLNCRVLLCSWAHPQSIFCN